LGAAGGTGIRQASWMQRRKAGSASVPLRCAVAIALMRGSSPAHLERAFAPHALLHQP
jgi:hypothetical protein